MQRINVKIAADGTISYDVNGIKGKKCTDATKFIDELAGNNVLERKKTGEYCEIETESEHTSSKQ